MSNYKSYFEEGLYNYLDNMPQLLATALPKMCIYLMKQFCSYDFKLKL